jgi:hypothetical protein
VVYFLVRALAPRVSEGPLGDIPIGRTVPGRTLPRFAATLSCIEHRIPTNSVERGRIVEKNVFDDPSVALLEEIREQNLNGGAGVAPAVWTFERNCQGWFSWAVGNNGNICTATVECQNTCGH